MRNYTIKIISLLLFITLTMDIQAQMRGRVPQDMDFNARLQELLSMPESYHRNQQIAVLFQLWPRFRPREAYQALHSSQLPDVFPLSVVEGMVISNWLKIDPDLAMQAAVNSNYPENLDLAFRMYAHQDGDAAFNLAKSLQSKVTMDTWLGIIEGISSWDPRRAADYVLEFGPGGEALISGFIYMLATQEPVFAIDWLLEHYPDETEHYDAIVARYFAINPIEAKSFIESLPDSRNKIQLLTSLERAEKISRGEMP